MALPSYWISVNRRDLAERAIIAKREQEARYIEKCESTAQFHRDANFLSSKYQSLENCKSDKIPRVNQESYIEEATKARRRENLHERRRKLAMLLDAENEKYMKELNVKSQNERENDPYNISELKHQIEELKRRKKTDEDELQRRNMSFYPTYKGTTPYAVEHEKAFEKKVKVAWEEKKGLEKQTLHDRVEEEKKRQELEQQKLQALKYAEEAEIERSEAEDKWAEKSKKIMTELLDKEEESDKLKANTEELGNYQQFIEKVIAKRKENERMRKEREIRISFVRQAKEKLRKFSAEVRNKLELDLKTLNYFYELETKADNSENNLAMEDVEAMIIKIKEQIALEQSRLVEVPSLYHEEAVKLWETRKQDWESEGEIHDEAMDKVLNGIKKQIEDMMAKSITEQRQLLKFREHLIKNLTERSDSANMVNQELMAKKDYFLGKSERLE